MVEKKTRALAEAILVTFLWSSSYILTKFGLVDINPLTLVGLRYMVASSLLVPFALLRGEHKKIHGVEWLKLAFLGVMGYSIAQGL